MLFLKKLLAHPFRLFAGLFRWTFKFLFYKILVKIYYQIFRWRKDGLIKKSPFELLQKQSIYFFIFILISSVFIYNLTDTSRAGAMETKISKTVMSNLIKPGFNSFEDEELIEETLTPNSIITAGKNKYIDDNYSLQKQTMNEDIEDLTQNESFLFNEDSDLVFKPQVIITESGEDGSSVIRKEVIYYTVQNGDTVSTIARRFGLTINTILWANNLSSFGLIRPGDSLMILPSSGLLYTVKKGDTLAKIAQTYGIELEKIINSNTLGNSLAVGQKIIIPGAKKINETIARRPASTNYTGVSVIKDLIKAPTTKTSGSKMAWPTSGYRITQYFSWRHNGVDIGNKVGTPIFAADDGVVILSQGGWNGGYGNTIVIDHGGGKKTRYGHASKLFVKVGDEVTKGENIATMGSTGRSTGSHLHFEVLINGARYNPLNYIR